MRPWHVKRLFRLPNRTRDEIRRDVSDEFAFHLDMRADELVREGLSPDDARRQAQREFGRADASARTLAALGDRVERRTRAGRFLGELWQDAGHFNHEVGAKVFDAIYGVASDFGVEVTVANFDRVAVAVETQRADFLARNPWVAPEIAEIFERARRLPPTPVR